MPTICGRHHYSCFKNKEAEVPRSGHYSTHGQICFLELPSVNFPAIRTNQHQTNENNGSE